MQTNMYIMDQSSPFPSCALSMGIEDGRLTAVLIVGVSEDAMIKPAGGEYVQRW